MRCGDCPELGETGIPKREVCCLRKPSPIIAAESARETAARIATGTGGKNRRQRRAERKARP